MIRSYEQFIEYCTSLVSDKMTRTTAKNLFDWMFPEEYSVLYEEKLAKSDEFIKYVTQVLVGDAEFIEEDYHND